MIRLSDHFNYKKLILFTLPTIATMIFLSVYSIVAGFFVSNFAGKTAFAAINMVTPVLMIVATIGMMLGTGGTALISKSLGEGDKKRANRYFSLFVYTALIIGVALAIAGFIFIRPIAIKLGADNVLLVHCIVYARICFTALPMLVLQIMFQSIFVVAERPKLGLKVTVLSGLTNMVLDAVLVILLPQEYKLAGAAIATAGSQIVGGGISLIYFMRKNSSPLRLGKTRFDGRALVKACLNGSSEFMSNISTSIVGILYNIQLMKYAGENGIAAYGVMMYAAMIFSGAFMGYSIGTAPIIGYHYGAQNITELRSIKNKSLKMVSIFGICMLLLAQVFNTPIARLFVSYDPYLLNMTVSGFRIFALSFALMGFSIFASSFFTALNDGVTSALISFFRTLVFQVLSVMLLPLIWGINGIWAAVVVAETLALLVSVVFLKIKKKKFQY